MTLRKINRTTARRLAATAAVLTLGLGLAACGDSADDGSASPASSTQTAANGDVFNDADVSFATDMIPHHAQAIEMVTMTDGRTLDPAVQQLADEIRNAQAPEVETMVDWLTAWGEQVPETSLDHVNGGHGDSQDTGDSHDPADSDMPGMMSADDMAALEAAPDGEFQTRWLEMMKQHHEGAIEMARTELEDGRFADAKNLAESIVTTQKAEIEEIDQLLAD
ncbi:DUF305 domain-containing protein [Nocardioides flavescens]|uniref:DUF305 domain-containing protein n=1 Tax=Nocardioides flavescens TaxID=2691959 RepID=A0A6L7EXZ3_9ACTN|nr:DUF305 domain-containing protein [Nocardioides flavescens]MXG88999.1 DUF305 domain-containing protein [Nocardioides flavescens]